MLISIPFELDFRLRIDNGMEGRMIIAWLFGLVRIPVNMDKQADPKSVKEISRPVKKRKRGNSRKAMAIVRRPGFALWSKRLFGRLLDSIRIYHLYLKLRLGLDDPADTGRLWALAGPVSVLLASIPGANISQAPDFCQAQFSVESEGRVRIYPVQFIIVLLVTWLSPSTWKLFYSRER